VVKYGQGDETDDQRPELLFRVSGVSYTNNSPRLSHNQNYTDTDERVRLPHIPSTLAILTDIGI